MANLLDSVEYPKDIRGLTLDELNQLAAEIRQEVISVVSEVGGHFASTLGAVELTLALHYVFNTPDDRIVWDTGIRRMRTSSFAVAAAGLGPFDNLVASVVF